MTTEYHKLLETYKSELTEDNKFRKKNIRLYDRNRRHHQTVMSMTTEITY